MRSLAEIGVIGMRGIENRWRGIMTVVLLALWSWHSGYTMMGSL